MGIFTPTGYSKKYCLLHPWEVAAHKIRDIHCAWQRAVKGYCYRDVWNIDYWFLQTMPKMIDDLIKVHHGYPGEMTDKEWVETLKKMHLKTQMKKQPSSLILMRTNTLKMWILVLKTKNSFAMWMKFWLTNIITRSKRK